MIENYIKYLAMLEEKLHGFFEKQKPYIFCHKGCSKCCENAQYPFTQIEFEFIKIGFNKLPYDMKNRIRQNVEKTLEQKHQFKGEKFMYVCPFLIDNVCSVYNYRGIICRTFGLLNADENKGSYVPFCAFEGLNYSNVFDTERKIISKEMYSKYNFEQEPLAFHVRYEFLTDEDFGKGYGFEFGPVKPLIDWFEN